MAATNTALLTIGLPTKLCAGDMIVVCVDFVHGCAHPFALQNLKCCIKANRIDSIPQSPPSD